MVMVVVAVAILRAMMRRTTNERVGRVESEGRCTWSRSAGGSAMMLIVAKRKVMMTKRNV